MKLRGHHSEDRTGAGAAGEWARRVPGAGTVALLVPGYPYWRGGSVRHDRAKHGEGKHVDVNGVTREGPFRHGSLHGHGKETIPAKRAKKALPRGGERALARRGFTPLLLPGFTLRGAP